MNSKTHTINSFFLLLNRPMTPSRNLESTEAKDTELMFIESLIDQKVCQSQMGPQQSSGQSPARNCTYPQGAHQVSGRIAAALLLDGTCQNNASLTALVHSTLAAAVHTCGKV